jgi:hypothetical protein
MKSEGFIIVIIVINITQVSYYTMCGANLVSSHILVYFQHQF